MVQLVEVGPRDGLQNERAWVPTAVKIAFVDALGAAGLGEIEVSAFVSPERVPQLADAEGVFAGIRRRPGTCYSALVPNARGLDRALSAGIDKACVFTAASETFNQKNIHTSVDGSLARIKDVIDRCRASKLAVRGYVSTAFWCPYEGPVACERVLAVVDRLLALGAGEVALGDTIGKATPGEVDALLARILGRVPAGRLALHLHDTFGRAEANLLAGWRLGVRRFDGSLGGLGGCPFAPGAAGNIATEAVVACLGKEGVALAVDTAALAAARRLIAPFVARLAPIVRPPGLC